MNTRRRPCELATSAHPASSSWGGARRGPVAGARGSARVFFLDFARAHDHRWGFRWRKPQFVCSLPTLFYASHHTHLRHPMGNIRRCEAGRRKKPRIAPWPPKLKTFFVASLHVFFILETIEMAVNSSKTEEFSLTAGLGDPLPIWPPGAKMPPSRTPDRSDNPAQRITCCQSGVPGARVGADLPPTSTARAAPLLTPFHGSGEFVFVWAQQNLKRG